MNRVQILRFLATGDRPVALRPGEPYVNWPDAQLGVVDETMTAHDLIAVRFFSPAANYNAGDYVVKSGALYFANGSVTAGAFNPSQWTTVTGLAFVDAPSDGQYYSRRNLAWTVSPGGLTDAANDGTLYARKSGVWSHVTHNDITDWVANVPAPYILLPASTIALGGVKVDGTTIKAAGDGTISTVLVPMGDNLVINGNFAVNQRALATGTAMAAGLYGHDRWKAGAGGCTYAFTAAVPDTTITITAGTLTQIIEAGMIEGGVYTLSWAGTAQARVYQGSPSGSYAASPITTPSLTAGTNTTVDFNNGGTVTRAKLEIGASATRFNRLSLARALDDCQRYFRTIGDGAGGSILIQGLTAAPTTNVAITIGFATMRAIPSVNQIGSFTTTNVQTILYQQGANSLAIQLQATAAGFVSLQNGVGNYITLSAEL